MSLGFSIRVTETTVSFSVLFGKFALMLLNQDVFTLTPAAVVGRVVNTPYKRSESGAQSRQLFTRSPSVVCVVGMTGKIDAYRALDHS